MDISGNIRNKLKSMKKRSENMKKIIIFSHEADIDGIGCIVLGKIAFNNIDYVLSPNPEKLELTFREYIQSGKLEEYDHIYVTDLALYDPALTMVAESNLKEKVLVFDHHKRSIDDNMNRYSFTTVIVKDEQGKRCGTNLFYEYLVKKHLLAATKAMDIFVEKTRQEDTWEWKNFGQFGEEAHDLAILFNAIGIKKYISAMTEKLQNNHLSFSFNDEEKILIQNKKEEYNEILKDIIGKAEYFEDENKNKFGIVFSNYEYRNEIPEYIIKNGNPNQIKYIIIAAMDQGEYGQKSYRSIEENFDVNKVASMHGGGGHLTASRVNITKEQKEKVYTLSKREGLKYLADSKYTS